MDVPTKKSTTTLPDNPTKCFTRRHLKGCQYLLWDYAAAISKKTGVFRLSGRYAALELGIHYDSVYDAVRVLTETGWFKPVQQNGRRADGTFEGRAYKVLDHDPWASKNPGKCAAVSARRTSQPVGQTPTGVERTLNGRSTASSRKNSDNTSRKKADTIGNSTSRGKNRGSSRGNAKTPAPLLSEEQRAAEVLDCLAKIQPLPADLWFVERCKLKPRFTDAEVRAGQIALARRAS